MIILKDFIENISIPANISFEYKSTIYEISTPVIDDFIDDNKLDLLNKRIYCIEPIIDENESRLLVKLND